MFCCYLIITNSLSAAAVYLAGMELLSQSAAVTQKIVNF